MTEYPEHEKLMAIKDESEAIGAFIDQGPYTLCELREAGDNGEPKYVWTGKWADPEFRASRRRRPILREHPRLTDFVNGWAEANPAYESWPTEYVAVHKSINQILAEWFDIDLDKIEAEKRAMLDELREANAR